MLVPMLLFLLPPPLLGQQDTTGYLEEGDRVRVWSTTPSWEGKVFELYGWNGDSLVLSEPHTAGVRRVPWGRVEQLQLQVETGKSHFWKGLWIGAGAGLLANQITVAASYCGDLGHTVCSIAVSHYTILPGLLLGPLVGAVFPKHEWISVEPAQIQRPEERRLRAWPVGIQVKLRVGG